MEKKPGCNLIAFQVAVLLRAGLRIQQIVELGHREDVMAVNDILELLPDLDGDPLVYLGCTDDDPAVFSHLAEGCHFRNGDLFGFQAVIPHLELVDQDDDALNAVLDLYELLIGLKGDVGPVQAKKGHIGCYDGFGIFRCHFFETLDSA